jgi:hypothetical protein
MKSFFTISAYMTLGTSLRVAQKFQMRYSKRNLYCGTDSYIKLKISCFNSRICMTISG